MSDETEGLPRDETTTRHTPGPWHAEQQGSVGGWIIESDHRSTMTNAADRRRKPSLARSRIAWGSLAWADTNQGAPYDHPEQEANARLMAAAPELLAALQEMLRTHDVTDGEPDYLPGAWLEARRLAVVAIAKAAGVEP